MIKVSFALVIHAHQPVGNFHQVFEEAYQKAYSPFLRHLLLHPRIRVSLHYSGILLEWLERRHGEFFNQLRELIDRGQAELLGGGYFEPILPAIPDADKITQVRKLANYLRDHFGVTPNGAWVAERVWEPTLARPLAEAGVQYTVLDDTHFMAAGLEPSELRGTYITEETGLPLIIVPSLKGLRYAIPFREPEEALRILGEGREGSERPNRPSPLFAMGDDCEKFGVWPGTFDHCYTNGWLEKFLRALEEAENWLQTTTVSDYMKANPPLARIYLPTASYAEMMEWVLPAGLSRDFKVLLEESERTPSTELFRRLLPGGLWRNFLSKYPEANQLHKLMLEVSRRWQETSLRAPARTKAKKLLGEAQTHLLAAQCNDAYWHGVFGGLYAPHLRSGLLCHLIQAEALLDRVADKAEAVNIRVETRDFDTDGQEEILFQHPVFGMVVRPRDGGTVSSLRSKTADVELINSLMRRPEAYHARVRQRVKSQEAQRVGPTSIHDLVVNKEANLDALLRYDRYARHAFRTYLFPAAKHWEDFASLRLDENQDLAAGPWAVVAGPATVGQMATFALQREARIRANGEDLRVVAAKTLTTKAVGQAWQLECQSSLSSDGTSPEKFALGIEMVFNLLAPDAPDRYFLVNDARHFLEFKGEIDTPYLAIVDEWQRVKINLGGQPPPRWWIVPIETISQSESGFERVYQGSAILAVWTIGPPAWQTTKFNLRVEIASLG